MALVMEDEEGKALPRIRTIKEDGAILKEETPQREDLNVNYIYLYVQIKTTPLTELKIVYVYSDERGEKEIASFKIIP